MQQLHHLVLFSDLLMIHLKSQNNLLNSIPFHPFQGFDPSKYKNFSKSQIKYTKQITIAMKTDIGKNLSTLKTPILNIADIAIKKNY